MMTGSRSGSARGAAKSSTSRSNLLETDSGDGAAQFHKGAYANNASRRQAKMSALSKVKLSVSCPVGSGNGGGRSDGRGADEQTRTQPDRCPGPPRERPSHPGPGRIAAAAQ